MEQVVTQAAKFQHGVAVIELEENDLVKDGHGDLKFVSEIELFELAYGLYTPELIGFRIQ